MIELIVNSYCNDCPEFEPDVDKNVFTWESFDFRDEPVTKCDTKITCKHKPRCESMIRQLKKEQVKQNEN